MSYLAQWVDPTIDIDEADTQKKIEKQEINRLVDLLRLAVAAAEIPRRLGSDATGEELSTDKKRCRRITHVAGQLIMAWSGGKEVKHSYNQDIKKQAAIVDWKRWWDEHQTWLARRQRYIATWASQQPDQDAWCKSAMVKLENEGRWLSYALRD